LLHADTDLSGAIGAAGAIGATGARDEGD
jgi:hypothetical protein